MEGPDPRPRDYAGDGGRGGRVHRGIDLDAVYSGSSLVPAGVALVMLATAAALLVRNTAFKVQFVLGTLLALILTAVLAVGGYYLYRTTSTLSRIPRRARSPRRSRCMCARRTPRRASAIRPAIPSASFPRWTAPIRTRASARSSRRSAPRCRRRNTRASPSWRMGSSRASAMRSCSISRISMCSAKPRATGF